MPTQEGPALVRNEDQFATDVFYAPGTYTISEAEAGTPYVALAVRTFVDPSDAADLKAVHALQDAIKVDQAGQGKFDIPNWDADSRTKIRSALLALAAANGGLDSARMFGRSLPRLSQHSRPCQGPLEGFVENKGNITENS